jgi:hypothetical protein
LLNVIVYDAESNKYVWVWPELVAQILFLEWGCETTETLGGGQKSIENLPKAERIPVRVVTASNTSCCYK